MIGSHTAILTYIAFFIVGVIGDVIYNILIAISNFVKDNFIVRFVAQFCACLIFGAIFLTAIFRLEEGKFALYELICTFLGITFQQIIVNFVAKEFKWVYNKFKKKEQTKEVEG